MATNREGSSARRQSRRLKILLLPKTSFDNPIEIDRQSNDEHHSENSITDKRDNKSHLHDDDDDFENPPAKKASDIKKLVQQNKKQAVHKKKQVKCNANRSQPDHEEETRSKVKRKLNVEVYEVEKSDKENITKKFKIRNSPNTLIDMVSALSDQQKEWVRRTGFGSILDFHLERIPHRLACTVLEAFDAPTCTLKLNSGSIQITSQDVYNVLGLPIGSRILTVATEDKASYRQNLWKGQFEKTNITTINVIERIRANEEVDELFKLNFLLVLSNVLIERQTGSYVHRDILSFDIELDECNLYNWGEYLIRCLVRTKSNWRKITSSLFYTGPIIFLIIFYVDRVTFKDQQTVERQLPAFKGWTVELLKQRQSYELKNGTFGSGFITTQQPAEIQEDGNTLEEDNNHCIRLVRDNEIGGAEQEKEENEAFTIETQHRDQINETISGPHEVEQRVEHWFERLNMKATMLMTAVDQYMSELESAKAKYPNDSNVSELEVKVVGMVAKIKEKTESEMILESKDMSQADNTKTDKDIEGEENPNVKMHVGFEVEEIDPIDLDHAELIEYLYSSQGKRDMEMDIDRDMDRFFVPSFSLGIESGNPIIDICKDINREHGTESIVEVEPNQNDTKTPAPEQKQKREKRETRLAAAYRSPYVRREIDIDTKYSTQEYAVWRWIIQKGREKFEHVFEYGDQYCIREHMATFKSGENLYYSVIDVWCTLMNDKENYKAPESPLRLFFNIAFSVGPLDETKSQDDQYQRFCDEMDHFFQRYPNKKLQDHDLVFFPVLQDEHYYLVCIHMKKADCQVIDNIRLGKAAHKVYGRNVRTLKNHFAKYLEGKELTSLAESLKKAKISYLPIKWQTLINYTDCGVFVMRHMETYKGSVKTWNTQFKTEKAGQKGQMDKLRTKYAHTILTSHLNERRQFVMDEAKLLYNKIGTEKLMSIVIAANSRKPKRVEISGTVLFPDEETNVATAAEETPVNATTKTD